MSPAIIVTRGNGARALVARNIIAASCAKEFVDRGGSAGRTRPLIFRRCEKRSSLGQRIIRPGTLPWGRCGFLALRPGTRLYLLAAYKVPENAASRGFGLAPSEVFASYVLLARLFPRSAPPPDKGQARIGK